MQAKPLVLPRVQRHDKKTEGSVVVMGEGGDAQGEVGGESNLHVLLLPFVPKDASRDLCGT
jgi:hypothetical protein